MTVSAHLPSGAGLSLDSDSSVRVEMAPRERTEVVFLVRADRPHEVNQGRPWTLTFRARADGLADRAEDTVAPSAMVIRVTAADGVGASRETDPHRR